MPGVPNCPSPNQFRCLIEEGGSAAEVEALANHLQWCETCGQKLETLLGQNAVVTTLRCSTDTRVENNQVFQAVKERLHLLRPVAELAQGEDKTLTLLSQTSRRISAGNSAERTEPGFDFLPPPQQSDEVARLAHYRLLEKAGVGGMGMVFRAEDILLRRKVALKVMLPTVAANPTARERFFREARSAARIEHPHIVPIYQVGEDQGVPFLAMPFLKGESLEDRLKRDGRLPLTEALRISAEMAEGLAAAHAEGLIHRDIKPGNVWLESGQGNVRLLDFGLVLEQTDEARLTLPETIVGTPAFMAPEQARCENVDGRADLFSLGMVLYLMLTGERPFKGLTSNSILASLALDTLIPPQVLVPDVPVGVGALVTQLLEKVPADRPTSAQEVAARLRALLQSPEEQQQPIPVRLAPPNPVVNSGPHRPGGFLLRWLRFWLLRC